MKYLIDRGIPARRACALVGLAQSSLYYEPILRMPRPVDPEVRRVVLETSEGRPSFGYRRMTAMVKGALGRPVNEKAVRGDAARTPHPRPVRSNEGKDPEAAGFATFDCSRHGVPD